MRWIKRGNAMRWTILTLGLVVTGIFATIPAVAQTKGQTIRFATVPWINAPIFIADKLGYWRDEGLDVKLEIIPSTPQQIELTVAGEIIGGSAGFIPFLLAVSRGVKIVALAELGVATRKRPIWVMLVAANSPIKVPADLKGKTIAVHAKGSVQDITLRSKILPALKLDPDRDVKIVEIPLPQMEGALKAGTIDAVAPIEPFTTRIAEKNRILSSFEEYIAPGGEPIAFVFMAERYVKQNPEIVRKFVKAYVRAVNAAHTMPANEVARIQAEYLKLPADLLARIPQVEFALDGRINVKGFQLQADELRRLGHLPKDVKVTDFIDQTYLPSKP